MAGTSILQGMGGSIGTLAAVAAGSDAQGNAAVIPPTSQVVNVTGAAATGVKLSPATPPGQTIYLINDANAKVLFPPVGGALNGGTVNASVALAASKTSIVIFDSALAATVIALA